VKANARIPRLEVTHTAPSGPATAALHALEQRIAALNAVTDAVQIKVPLSERSVCRTFGVSRDTLRVWRARKGLLAYTIAGEDGGGGLRFFLEDLARFMVDHLMEAPPIADGVAEGHPKWRPNLEDTGSVTGDGTSGLKVSRSADGCPLIRQMVTLDAKQARFMAALEIGEVVLPAQSTTKTSGPSDEWSRVAGELAQAGLIHVGGSDNRTATLSGLGGEVLRLWNTLNQNNRDAVPVGSAQAKKGTTHGKAA
jgi:hypothetical protein